MTIGTIGELRALPVGRGHIGEVRYLPVGVAPQSRGRGHVSIVNEAKINNYYFKRSLKLLKQEIQP